MSSTGDVSRGPLTGDPTTEEFVDPTIVVDPSPSTSSSSSMCIMLEMCLIVQVAHGQLLLDLLNEVAILRADFVDARGASPPAPPSDQSCLPFGNVSQKGGVHRIGGDDIFFWCRLYLGAYMF